MKRQYVTDLAEGVRVDSEFVLSSKEFRLARSGEGYLVVELGDRSGSVPGVLFRPDRLACEIAAGTVATVRGVLTTYRGQPRVSIETLAPARRYRREDMVPGGTRDRRELLAEFKRLVAAIEAPAPAALARAVFSDKAFLAAFLASPSSAAEDHPYVGGLLEHTVGVGRACAALGRAHPEVDPDLLLAAALLHDVGKVDALACDTAIRGTDEGRLLGHVALGHARVAAASAASAPSLPAAVLGRLTHAVLAHHDGAGGSGVEPVTLEALLLREADRTDRACSRFLLSTLPAARAEEDWTPSRPGERRSLSVPGPPGPGAASRA